MTLATAESRQTEQDFHARAGAATAGAAAARTSAAPCRPHSVSAGDTLTAIAAARLGDANRWREISRLNPGVSPERLRIGTELRIPCAARPPRPSASAPVATAASEPAGAPASSGAAGAGEGAPATGSGFLARLFGPRKAAVAAEPAPGKTAAAAPAAETAPEPRPETPPVPVWTAGQGEYLADVLRRWGRAAGWTVLADTADAWRLAVPVRIRAPFDTAVAELVRGLGHEGSPPRVRLHPNRVLRLGGPL